MKSACNPVDYSAPIAAIHRRQIIGQPDGQRGDWPSKGQVRVGHPQQLDASGAAAGRGRLIGFAGFPGYTAGTTHVVTGGIVGPWQLPGARVRTATVLQIAAAWRLTLPAAIAISGGLSICCRSPRCWQAPSSSRETGSRL